MSVYFNSNYKKNLSLLDKIKRKFIFNKAYLYSFFNLSFYKINCFIEEERNYGVFFSLITLATIIGVTTYFNLNFTINFIDNLSYIGIVVSLLVYLFKYKKFKNILLLCLAFLLGLFFAHFEDWRYNTKMLGGVVNTMLTAKLLTMPYLKNDRYRLLLEIENSEKPHLKFLPKIVMLSSRAIPSNLQTHDVIKGLARLYAVSGPIRVNGYDFAFYDYFKSIGAQGYFLGDINYIKSAKNLNVLQKINNKLQNLKNIINQKIKNQQDNEEGSIACALITGDRSGISEDTNNALRQAGLAHILAISGLHMSIVTGLVFVFIRYFLSIFMKFGCYFPIKKIAAFFAILSADFYFALSGGSPSAQRSFIMVLIIFTAILFDKQAITIRNLLIAIWVVIIIYPHQILDPSFQMSFGSAAALISLYKTYKNNSDNKFNKNTIGIIKPNIIWQIVENIFGKTFYLLINTALASFVAGSASSIFAIYHFGNFAPYAVISNVMAGSIISFLVMPFALISVLTMPFHCEHIPLEILTKTISWVEKIAFYIANATPYIPIKVMTGYNFAYFCFGFCILIIFRTKLRLIGAIIIIFGFIMYYKQNLPIAVIEENGKMLTLLLPNHEAILYSKHPSDFILKDWKKSFLIQKTIKPKEIPNLSYKLYIVNSFTELQQALKESTNYKIIYVNYYNYTKLQSNDKITFIFKRQLALNGTVEIYKNKQTIWAVPSLQRSWTNYRKYNSEDF